MVPARRHLLSAAIPLSLLAAALACGCRQREAGPSILLFVMDTTRVDAVSAYGAARGTTPAVDALAAEGLRYAHAYANASWTLPSHATLFTGLAPQIHGVGWGRLVAPDSLDMLAEKLQRAGYDTFGFSENPWVSPTFKLTQGFDHFTMSNGTEGELQETVRELVRERRPDRPFFLFVNVVDAHWPYTVREKNPFLPSGVSHEQAAAVSQWPPDDFCAGAERARARQIEHGLYLGDVHAADTKLAVVRAALADAGLGSNLVTIATADHGEHFGEHRLGHHQFSVREALLHVPLVIAGAPGNPRGAIDEPVQLADILPTVLAWAHLPQPAGLTGRPLPVRNGSGAPRDLSARFLDPDEHAEADMPTLGDLGRKQALALRSHCGPNDRVWGNMRALIRYPLKLIWFERYPAEVYDLEKDPNEEHDLAAERPDLIAAMTSALGLPRQTPSGGDSAWPGR